jgi:hypothetical protein
VRAAFVIVLALAIVPRVARAERVGLVVLGDTSSKSTREAASTWFRDHADEAVMNALPRDAVKTLQDCFLVDDPKCSRSVIEARATENSVVTIRVELSSKKDKDVRVTIDWFIKGHNAISSRRTCDACSESALKMTLDAMLTDLAKSKPGFMGRIKVGGTPGLSVLVDGATVGVTPLDQAIPAGSHKIRLAQDGRMGAEQSVTVKADAATEVTLEAPPTEAEGLPPQVIASKPSRVLPGVMIGVGIAGMAAGTALYLTSEEPTGANRTYRDTKKLGIGVAAGGAAVALTGVIIILATGRDSGPTVAMTPDGGAAVSWFGRF